MFKYLTLENLENLVSIVFWAMFYAWTAVSIVALLYAVGERLIVGGQAGDYTIRYDASAATKGLWLGVAGLVGAVVGWLILPLAMGAAPFAMPSRLFAGATSGQTMGLAITVVSAMVFNFGVWLGLTSEEWAEK